MTGKRRRPSGKILIALAFLLAFSRSSAWASPNQSIVPSVPPGSYSVPQLIRFAIPAGAERTDAIRALVAIADHLSQFHTRKNVIWISGDFPVAAGLYPEIITLPLYPDMTEAEVAYVCDSLKQILAASLKSLVS